MEALTNDLGQSISELKTELGAEGSPSPVQPQRQHM